MELHKRLAHDIENDREMKRIPLPIIEAVLLVGLAHLANIVPVGFDASEMDAADFEGCEMCTALIDPSNPAGARMDSDGIWLCDACQVEDGATASPPENAADADRKDDGR